MKKFTLLQLVLITAVIIASLIAYPHLPETVASHWDINGQPNGFMSKAFNLALVPGIMLFIFVLSRVIPRLDPLRKNIDSFRLQYEQLWLLVQFFLAYIFALTLIYNLGHSFNFSVLIVPGLAGLWYFLGVLLAKSKRNWFIGIRTPWTLSSDEVWARTHRLGGRLFKAAGLIALFGLLFGSYWTFWFLVLPVLLSAVVLVVYSYIVYRRLS